jgi:ribosomal protein S18 acetylase RimI-like enzyme
MSNIKVRRLRDSDWAAVWRILKPVFRAGDTYAFDPEISETEAMNLWVQVPEATYVAIDEQGEVLATYYIKPNHAGGGKHVCNCGYVVDPRARGRGLASQMCEHSQSEGIRKGFLAMQYNFVVSTNQGAVRLWKRHGFEIAGTLARAFKHPTEGYVDAFIMYKTLCQT